MWSIRVLSGAQSGHIYDLKRGKNLLGRGGTSDFKVQSLGISKEHCEIHVYKDKMMIVDLKSSNGTFVNGVKIQNSIIRVGDKVSLFDVIMDIIPTPDIRPKSDSNELSKSEDKSAKQKKDKKSKKIYQPPIPSSTNLPTNLPQYPMNYPQHGGAAMQVGFPQPDGMPFYPGMQSGYTQPNTQAEVTPPAGTNVHETFDEKLDHFMETKVMPAIYRLGAVFSFKQILQAFVIVFIFLVTILSTLPLSNIIKESNYSEAGKRAKSVARALAKANETALLAGQIGNLSVTDALKEEGIKEALIIQHSDGAVIAPSEKAGRAESSPLVLAARRESQAKTMELDAGTIGATFPIIVYDPNTGEASPKYHVVVKYDISSLNLNEERVVSLFMQTLIISTLLGLLMFQLFARLIEHPIRSLNQQIDKALVERTDKTEVVFDYPSFQKLISNVNIILNRAWSVQSDSLAANKPQQNKDLEFSNLVDMISHPAVVIDTTQRVVAMNQNFEQLTQVSRDSIINQSYQGFSDSSLVQNIDSLIARCNSSPYERQADRIPFSQFECEIFSQAFLNQNGEPEYYVLTLVQTAAA
jgi:hypothetical protein